ncbi:MAG: Acetyltransferase, GNAT family protein [uncultured bacterium]|nr:MAG: Acetyltransferase, GNAT family protein [uncultured bacterium]OGJ48059.1 MAG: hypothetical protein A2244_01040 [Candidatus Peregrinibacteria bacterium RIFOXYA2_FULL_41_18]OGJ48753.1 MAG: hypothetical protein A2344_01975 [Candidatus Peregrinibacteria bacterium RIFOXYB12_FULL_41_12]
MIKILNSKDKKTIVDFCMKNERENLFVLGSFLLYKNGFKLNRYIGHFENNKLTGLAVYFPMYKSFVINASSVSTINKLVDFAINQDFHIETIPVFKKYAGPAIKRLKNKHGLIPKEISRQTVFMLEKKFFVNLLKGNEVVAKAYDLKELVMIDRILNNKDINMRMSKEDKDKIDPKTTFILKRYGKISTTAKLHGMSENYFQIGGVITLPAYRGKGYAKMVVSKLCEHYFEKGFKYGLLFTADKNIAARKVYKKLGFKPVDKFIIAEY